MKKYVLIFLSVLGVLSTSAQQAISDQYIPDILKNKMATMYPDAKGIYWKQPMPGFMDAYFSINKHKCNATFQVTGAWVSTDFEIDPADFPDTASQYLTQHVDKVSRYYRSESKAKGIQYSADAKVGGEVLQFIFDKEGHYLMKGPRD
ncbi:MAG TPA: hypothetical protein VE978_24140 [Chitinophagales bacterium]|nr:hypothetical protein [Chitinophagales bacterium]